MVDVSTPPSSALGTQAAAQPANRAATVGGHYQGQRVGLIEDPVAMLEDAAEELTFAHSEKVEKKLAKRKMGKSGLKTFAAEQAERYLKQVPDIEKNKKLADFAKQIAQLHRPASAPQLRQLAKQSYPDVSHQFLALAYARDYLQEAEADPELVANLNTALSELEEHSGAEIRAGINISPTAAAAAQQGVGDVQGLRDFYRDVVLDYASTTQAYNKIIEEHGHEKFIAAVGFLLDALAVEVGNDHRSLPKNQLKAVMDDIYQLKLLGGMYYQCTDLMERVQRNYQSAMGRDGQALLQEILQLKEKGWYSNQLIESTATQLGVEPLAARIYFFKGLKDLIRLIPHKAFEDVNKRAELMDHVQQVLDAAVDQEFEA